MTTTDAAIRWMFHSTAMVPDYDAARDRLAELGGLVVLEYSDNPTPEIGRRGGMCWIGDNSIEIGQPTVAAGGAARFVERTGGGMHSIAVQVDDIETAIAHVENCDAAVAARPMPEMFFTDPRRTDGVFVEWAAFELHIDPRFGAALPPPVHDPLLDVTHHGFVGAIVDEPVATAERLVELFGTGVTFDHPHAPAGEPRIGVSLGDCSLALYAMPRDDSVTLWAAEYRRPRCHLLGLVVGDLEAALGTLDGTPFTVHRRTDTMAVLDPATTGRVQIALVDALLPGDPRGGGTTRTALDH